MTAIQAGNGLARVRMSTSRIRRGVSWPRGYRSSGGRRADVSRGGTVSVTDGAPIIAEPSHRTNTPMLHLRLHHHLELRRGRALMPNGGRYVPTYLCADAYTATRWPLSSIQL